MRPTSRLSPLLVAAVLAAACQAAPAAPLDPAPPAQSGTDPAPPSPPAAPVPSPSSPAPSPSPSATPGPSPEPEPSATAAPAWLGTRVLDPGPTGFAPPQATPPELFPRSIATTSTLQPPGDDQFAAAVTPVPDEVLARSTWGPRCPVTRDDLRWVTVSFWGFDGGHHTGELLVHRDVADDVVTVFAVLHDVRFPIERMAVTSPEELDAPPTGDDNNTTAFVCRATVGTTTWSAHAHGLAIDVNPFHNPYVRDVPAGRIVLPELATAYTDRTLDLPGMIHEGGPVVAAFDAIGWTWGGRWRSLTDPHHFSATGR